MLPADDIMRRQDISVEETEDLPRILEELVAHPPDKVIFRAAAATPPTPAAANGAARHVDQGPVTRGVLAAAVWAAAPAAGKLRVRAMLGLHLQRGSYGCVQCWVSGLGTPRCAHCAFVRMCMCGSRATSSLRAAAGRL